MTCYHCLLCQVSEIVSLLKQLWPEGSDIRRVFCVTSCSLFLEMYHSYLENREKRASTETSEVTQVWWVHRDTGCYTGIQVVTRGYAIDLYCCLLLLLSTIFPMCYWHFLLFIWTSKIGKSLQFLL